MKQTSQGVKARIVIGRIKSFIMQLVKWLLSFMSLIYISFTTFLSIYCLYYAFAEEENTIIMTLLIIYGCKSFVTVFPELKFLYNLIFK